MSIKQTICKLGFRLKRGTPTMLSCLAVAGTAGTAILAVKETPKAIALLEEAKILKGDALTPLEVVQTAGPVYIPAVCIGLSTIACILGANALNKQQQASIASAYALVDQAYREYRNKIRSTVGDNVDREVRDGILRDHLEGEKQSFTVSNGKHLFYDQYSNRYFEMTMGEVHDAEYHLNRNYALRGYAELNEFYELLGLTPTDYGMSVGWSFGAGEAFYGYSWIDFEHELVVIDEDLECYNIIMSFGPTADFMDYY